MVKNTATEPHQPPSGRNERLAEQIFPIHEKRLFLIARRNTDTESDAEEALQDTFAIFLDHYNPDGIADPLAWITLTLKRRCWAITTAARHRHPTTNITDLPPTNLDRHDRQDSGPSTEHLAEIREEAEDIGRHLRLLKPDQRQALTLLALGYSYREIARHENWSYTKVNRSITEGRATLRKARKNEAA